MTMDTATPGLRSKILTTSVHRCEAGRVLPYRWMYRFTGHPSVAWVLLHLLLLIMMQVCQSQKEDDYLKNLNPSSELPPIFLDTPLNVTAREGTMAVLPCAVQHLGTRQVAWRRVGATDGHFLTVGTFTWVRGDNVMIEYHQEPGFISHWNLLLKHVSRDDAGVYECQITAKEKYTRYINLDISGPPISEPAISVKGKKYVEKGEAIHLICNATGGSQIPEDIDWFKDGTKIDSRSENDIVITKFRSLEHQALISELIIDHSRMGDTGTYICRSSEKEIDSLKVTVLIAADTNNVKREKPEGSTNGRLQASSSATNRVVLTSWIPIIFTLLLLT